MDEQAVTVYYRPMLLIFCTILVSKLLRSMVTPLSSRVVRLVTPLPDTVHKLRSEIAVAKKKASSISITDDFPVRARLNRTQNAKETELSAIEGRYRSQLFKTRAVLEAVAVILLECLPVLVVVYYRSEPIVALPPQHMWPIASIAQFPTQVSGAIGPPIWAVCTRQTLHKITSLFLY